MAMSRTEALGIAVCVVLVISGIAGIALGGPSAMAGWWLVIVFGFLLAWIIAGVRRSRVL